MTERDESVFAHHMLDAIERIERYVDSVTKEEFRSDDVLQDAVVRQLGILGEAGGRVSKETCEANPDVP